jgi:polyadenylate-binding protein
MNFTDIKGKACRIMWSQRDPSVRRSGLGNIFVKNLQENIDNKQLYDTFSLFGNILSCKVVCDKETGKSKGYGYVHYETNEAAANAIEKLDGMLIDGKEVQVGIFQRRDTRPDQASWTNCFIKNIPYDWDEDRLRKEFESFGEIASVSISMGKRRVFPKKKKVEEKDEEGAEKKEGEEGEEKQEEGAEKESEEEKPTEKETPAEEPAAEEEEEKEESNEPESLGFGFVNFVEHESAAKAVEEMNEKEFETEEDGEKVTKALYVGRAQKKAERERELRQKFEADKMERIAKFQGVNLYVKNLDDSVTDDILRDEFSAMGTITSARVMKDLKTGVSRGFGFVCYSTPEDSTRAVNEMNGKLIAGKPIFVALAQRRDVRRAQLEAQHNQGRGSGPGQPGMMRGPMGGPMGGYPGGPGMYMPGRPGPGGMQPAYPMGPQMMGGRGGYVMQGQPGRPGAYPMPGYGMMPAQPGRGGPGGRGPGRGPGGRGPGGPGGRGPGGRGMPGQPPIKFNQQARNAGGPPPPQGPGMQQPPAAQPMPASNEQLTPAALASASPEQQKNMIGERLYPLIHNTQPELAGKITGMLLEMDNSELLHLLESPEALNAKIQEALQVLDAHQSAQK